MALMEEFYKSVLEQDEAAVVLCDLNHIIVYMNPAAACRYAKSGGYELVGKSLMGCHNEKSNEMIYKVVDWFKGITAGGKEHAAMSSDGIIFRPYLDGGPSPERNLNLTASFSGLKSTHTYENLLQAVYEGLCFEAKKILFTISEFPDKIILVGGGSKNSVWQQIKSDVFNLPLVIPRNTEATALGAAVLAGIGCGLYKDQQDALSNTFSIDRVITPQAPEKYTELCRKYFGD